MKNKYLLEIEESNVRINDMAKRESYSGSGLYLNTDENGTKALVLIPKNEPDVICLMSDWGSNTDIKEIFLEPLKELPEDELGTMPEISAGVDGNMLIKAIAVAQNPELIKDILSKE